MSDFNHCDAQIDEVSLMLHTLLINWGGGNYGNSLAAVEPCTLCSLLHLGVN